MNLDIEMTNQKYNQIDIGAWFDGDHDPFALAWEWITAARKSNKFQKRKLNRELRSSQ